MTMRQVLLVMAFASILDLTGVAAPSLPVVRPMVSPALSYTGPTNDTHAECGQWFRNLNTTEVENRTHEFYDNTLATGGGTMGPLAISGVVVSVTIGSIGPGQDVITAFDVLATVFNDAHSAGYGPWTNGVNSHDESLATQNYYTNILEQIILTADFAIYNPFPIFDTEPTYTDRYPYICAVTPDYLGWFGWDPNRPDETLFGNFDVPGWDFGSILPGQSTNRLLHFIITERDAVAPAGIPASDPRYDAIMTSSNNQSDIFINRSSSLKINTWASTPSADDGSLDYPMEGTNFLGNVSVFHNIASDPQVAIIGVGFQPSPLALIMNSVGSSGVVKQILQSNTNLMTTNWANIATNLSWPLPVTNSWTNVISGPQPVNFYRIIQ